MKYYFIETQHLSDGTAAQAIYAKESFDSALAAFHASMAYAMQGTAVEKVMCMVVDEDGYAYKSEVWKRAEDDDA